MAGYCHYRTGWYAHFVTVCREGTAKGMCGDHFVFRRPLCFNGSSYFLSSLHWIRKACELCDIFQVLIKLCVVHRLREYTIVFLDDFLCCWVERYNDFLFCFLSYEAKRPVGNPVPIS